MTWYEVIETFLLILTKKKTHYFIKLYSIINHILSLYSPIVFSFDFTRKNVDLDLLFLLNEETDLKK